jgi:hypothetical protein
MRIRTAAAVESEPTHEEQNDEDDENDTNQSVAAVPKAVTVPAEASAETPEQEYDKNNDEYESDRHELPRAVMNGPAPLIDIRRCTR